MDKRLWINIGLLGFIFLLSILIFGNGEKNSQELQRLSNIDQNNITQIKILRKDLKDFEFNKQDETWQLTTPQQFRANKTRINAMLRMLNVKSHSELNPSEVNLESLGLKNPTVIMKLNDHEFKFGKTDAIDQRRYVLFEGNIYLTNDFLYQQLMTNVAFFADPKLLPESFKISSIEFPENKIESVNSQWQLQTPMDIAPDQLKRIVFSWENTSAISAEEYQPAGADSVIKISSANNKTIQFDIISTEPHLILGRKDIGLQYHMGSDVAAQILLEQKASNENDDDPVMLIN